MIGIGRMAPPYRLEGVQAGQKRTFSLQDFRGRWLVLFFYPADFTFICPTEILAFQKKYEEFTARSAEVVGISVDSVETHANWAKELGGISYPLLSDSNKLVSTAYSVLHPDEGVAGRATFIIDPSGIVQFEMASAMNVGRSVDETLRVLKALQSGRLCPADWRPGQETGDISLKY